MKIFQTLQMHLAFIGYAPNLRPFNKRQNWLFAKNFVCITLIYVQLLHVANSPNEYMDSIFMTVVATLVSISHISTTFQMKTLFIYIDEIEKLFNASKF